MPAFIPWTATAITQQLVATAQATVPQITDFTRGSVLRGIFEAQAISTEAIGQQIATAVDENMQMTLQRAVGKQPDPARAAYGQVIFSVPTAPTQAVVVPAGLTVGVPLSTLTFVVGGSVTWPAGATTLAVIVTCTSVGAQGNVPAQTITQIVSAVPPGLTGLTVSNPLALTTGADAETLLEATAQVPARLAQLKAATGDALAGSALKATVTDASGYVTEAVSRALSADGGYVAAPSTAPVLTAVSGSTALAAGTYTVGYTWTTAYGETPLSPTAAVSLAAGDAIQVGALALPTVSSQPPSPVATGVRYYLSSAAGSTTLLYDANGTGGAVTLTALPASGAAPPPTVNTAFAATPGFGTVWIANDLGTAPSAALLTAADQQVTGYTDAAGRLVPGTKAAGILTQVVAAQILVQNIALTILPQPGYTLAMIADAVALAVAGYFAGLDIGDAIRVTALLQAVTQVPGVSDAAPTTPTANVAGVWGALWTVGTVATTAWT